MDSQSPNSTRTSRAEKLWGVFGCLLGLFFGFTSLGNIGVERIYFEE